MRRKSSIYERLCGLCVLCGKKLQLPAGHLVKSQLGTGPTASNTPAHEEALPMDFLDLARKRYSVRSYKRDPVEKAKLERILEAGRLAPTAVNIQPFQLLVVHTAGREAELLQIYNKQLFVQPPLVICACGIPGKNWVRKDGKNYNDVDVAIVMDHLILAATAEGLGTCWIAAFDPAATKEVLGLPVGVEPLAFTPLGYAADDPPAKKRKPLSELVRYEKW
jgi:nitroreductase